MRDLDDAAEIHDGDAVGDVAHHGEIVGDEDVGEPQPLLQLHEQVHHLRLDRHVERRDRLVADDEARVERERAGDADALALAAGELVRIALGHVGQQADHARSARRRARDRHRGSPATPCTSSGSPMMSRTCHARIERAVGVLVDHLHAPADRPHALLVVGGDVLALEHDAAGRRLQHAQHGEPGGRLAAAALADQPERLAAPQREADAVDRLDGRRPGAG